MIEIASHECFNLCKKLDDWPEPDQTLWRAALLPADLFEVGGARAAYSDLSNRAVVAGYGRWLTWLEQAGILDLGSSPGDRISPTRVAAYVAALEKENSTQTMLNRLQELRAAAQVLAPHQDSLWINTIASTIRARHRPARPKRQRVVPLKALFDLGLNLIQRAESSRVAGRGALVRRAILHRDGLIIALLAARVLRLANLAGLVLDHTLVRNGTQWWIQIPGAETKNGDPIERPWPDQLIAPLDDYLSRHRQVLLGARRGAQRTEWALWVALFGSRMTMAGIYGAIVSRTRQALGRGISPHLFRDSLVTSLAIEAPQHIGIGTPLLGHRSVSTTERYYNQAGGIEASRLIQANLLALRHTDRGNAASKPTIR